MLLPEGIEPYARIGERLAAAMEEVASGVEEAQHALHTINKATVLCILDGGLRQALDHFEALLCSVVLLLRLAHLRDVDLGTCLRLLGPNMRKLLSSALETGISLVELLALVLKKSYDKSAAKSRTFTASISTHRYLSNTLSTSELIKAVSTQ